MRFSIRWLKQYLNMDLPVDEIIETMMMAGLEVEEEIDLGMRSGKIVIARVTETAPHPQSDHLTLCKVDAGGEPLSIVCGAPNVKAGEIYPCALLGATLPGGMVIEPRKIRGIASQGMLCSAAELMLSQDHSGIMQLPDDSPIGEPFDFIVDIKVTPNRPDCLSILGVAREVAAMHGKKVYPPKPRPKEMLTRVESLVKLSVPARNQCPRYTCRLIKGVTIGESPLWMRRRLEASGLRSINNVVDVTNYVLLELGHPLHAFDFDNLAGGEIRVRTAETGEKLTIIDGTEMTLTAEDLLIADANRGVALAGVMGGLDSEVRSETTNVLLESAYFDPVTIRRTSKRYGISTDASYRFERGTDREGLTLALHRAAQLIQELAGGEIARGVIDVQTAAAERPPIVLDLGRVNRLLGIELTGTQVADYLANLGFEVRGGSAQQLIVSAPSHRVDVSRDVDLIEDIARLYNYNNIPKTLPRTRCPIAASSPLHAIIEGFRDSLARMGLFEAMSFSFISEADASRIGFDPARQPRIANPLTVDQVIMRPSVLPGVLAAVGLNQKRFESSIALFEIGKVWPPDSKPADPDAERWEAVAVLTGPLPPTWSAAARDCDFYDMKGIVESLISELDAAPEFEPLTDSPVFHPGRSARLLVKGQTVGELGELHPELAAALDLRGRVYLARIEMNKLAEVAGGAGRRVTPVPRFPASDRDLALVVARDLPVGQILDATRRAAGAMLEDLVLFDVYEGDRLPADKKSIGLSLRLRSPEKTLTEDEIKQVMDKVTRSLEKQFGATLRS
ncbi:phenylalanine--tRNA ligase subunit beta [bacterium]|nr:phenylalanine--tRNA ligase subunit beta [bacterium]